MSATDALTPILHLIPHSPVTLTRRVHFVEGGFMPYTWVLAKTFRDAVSCAISRGSARGPADVRHVRSEWHLAGIDGTGEVLHVVPGALSNQKADDILRMALQRGFTIKYAMDPHDN